MDFSFLTRRLEEHWNSFEAVGNACGVSFHPKVGEGRLLTFIKLQAGTQHLSGGSGGARKGWGGRETLDREMEMLPKSRFVDYMAVNKLVLRRLWDMVESCPSVIVVIIPGFSSNPGNRNRYWKKNLLSAWRAWLQVTFTSEHLAMRTEKSVFMLFVSLAVGSGWELSRAIEQVLHL